MRREEPSADAAFPAPEPFVWIDDLSALDPEFLAEQFDPELDGTTLHDVALALTHASPRTRAHILKFAPAKVGDALAERFDGPPIAGDAEVSAAIIRVVAVYLWSIVYRRHPGIYEQFSQAQVFRFERLFPPERLRGRVVAELGCGTGRLTDYAARHAAAVHGVDPVDAMLEIARAKQLDNPSVSFAVGTFGDIPLAPGSVDIVISNLAFQPFDRAGGPRGLDAMKRLLRDGGEIRMTVGNPQAQNFLLDHGFRETFIPGGLRITVPPQAPMLVRMLADLARRGAGRGPSGRSGQHYLCAAGPWRWRWSAENALAALRGGVWRDLFLDGDIRRPIGLPVYSWGPAEAGLRPTEISRAEASPK